MQTLLQDLRYGVRRLARKPSFTIRYLDTGARDWREYRHLFRRQFGLARPLAV